jgi:hypothetical protein
LVSDIPAGDGKSLTYFLQCNERLLMMMSNAGRGPYEIIVYLTLKIFSTHLSALNITKLKIYIYFFLKVWWPYATLFAFIFSLYNTVDTFIQFIHKHSLRPISKSSQLSAQWAEPPWWCQAEIRSRACLTAS